MPKGSGGTSKASSSYARQFVGQMQKPPLEHIEGLSPAIAIEQKHLGHTPRSTVGTVTEIYDYLRILFARLGQPYCPDCDIPIGTQTADEIIDKIMAEPAGTKLYLHGAARGRSRREVRSRCGTSCARRAIMRDARRRHDASARRAADRSTAAASTWSKCVIDRVTRPRRRPLADRRQRREAPWPWARACCTWPIVDEDDAGAEVADAKFTASTSPATSAGAASSRSRRTVFRSTARSAGAQSCEGLGAQTGANPAALLRDPKLTLAEGAVAALARRASRTLFASDAGGARRRTPGCRSTCRSSSSAAKQRRTVLHGMRRRVDRRLARRQEAPRVRRPLFRFQYKGLYPGARRGVPAVASSCAASWSIWSAKSSAPPAAAAGCATMPRRCGCAGGRWTSLPACRWASCSQHFDAWKLERRERKIAGELVREVRNRLQFLVDVGLRVPHARLARAPTLSGGEAQRIRLASQVGSGLCGVLYVLDEPTIGLHPRDNSRLLEAPAKAPRPGQHAAGGRARPRSDRRRPITCSTSAPPPASSAARSSPAARRPKSASRKGRVTGPYLSGEKAIPCRRTGECRMPTDECEASAKRRRRKACARKKSRRDADRKHRLPCSHNRSLNPNPNRSARRLVGDRRRRHNNLQERHRSAFRWGRSRW